MEVSRHAPQCLAIKCDNMADYLLQQPVCWHNTNKAVVGCFGDGESRRAQRKTLQACMEHANRRLDQVQVQRHRST